MLRPAITCPFALISALALPALASCGGDDGGGDASAGDSTITSASQGATTSTSGAGDPTGATTSASGSAGESDSAATTTTTGVDSSSTTAATTDDTAASATTADTTAATTASTDTDTDTDTEDTGEAIEPCQVEEGAITPIPSDLLFVLDKSGSMSMELWDHDKNAQTPKVTRWRSLYSVVEAVVTKFEDKLHFGAKLYPKIDAGSFINQGACEVTPGVEVPVAPNNAAALLMVVPGPDVAVLGGTPSYQGLKQGYTYLNSLNDGLERAIIFITDGEISCDDPPAAAIAAISDANKKSGIPTYVVGVDVDAQTAAQLDLFAAAGGKPVVNGDYKFYQTLDQIQLEAAMQKILDDTVSCVLPVDPDPAEPDLFEIWLDGAKIPKIADCAQESGWLWSHEFNEVTLCGAACSSFKKGQQVTAKYYCIAG
jgi:Mg-chelatase subunit ChlD